MRKILRHDLYRLSSLTVGCLLYALLLCLGGCEGAHQSNQVEVGVDPTWFPLDTEGQESRLLAFSTELYRAIGKKEKLIFSFVFANSDTLMDGLQQGKYAGILSPLNPKENYRKKLSFSDPYLLTGPSLIKKIDSSVNTLADLKGKEIGFIQGSSIELFLQQRVDAILRSYLSVIDLLDAIEKEEVDAGVLSTLLAQNYVGHLYSRKLTLQGPPLTEEGLYFVALAPSGNHWVKKVNEGLGILKKKGEYEILQTKWGLLRSSISD